MSNRIDLTGKKIGLWTVLSKAKTVSGRGMWNCVCECGTERAVLASSLINGRTKSCGCLNKKKDLSGSVFGDLTVLRFEGYSKKNPKWICKCSCGEIVSVFESGLKSGRTKNCGGVLHSKYVGKRYGRLVVLPNTKTTGNGLQYLCRCDCGKEIYSTIGNLTSENTKSCGCLSSEIVSKRNKTHGMSGTRIYDIWSHMIARCEKPYDKRYGRYGARGISVCDEWHKFEEFYKWAISSGYKEDLTIDRIDVDGGYCPENCRWATYKQQENNTSKNVLITFNGETKTLSEWADFYKISYKTLHQRIRVYKWDFERAVTQRVKTVEKTEPRE